tara:strand:+ start:2704 stop:3261 length:558 start_codon:yes stop_codon:yes gene_type:complete
MLALLICFLLIEPVALSGNSPHSLKDFQGLKLNLFDERTGRRYLKVSYKEVVSEKKKIGFLTMNLSFLRINDLKIEMDANYIESTKISSLFQKVSSQRGIRYAVAEPIRLIIRNPQSNVRIVGQKGKFTADGSLRIWGDVSLIHGTDSKEMDELSISTDEAQNCLLLTGKKERIPLLTLPLSRQP